MELKDHLRIIHKNLLFILVFTVVLIVGTSVYFVKKSASYDAVVSFDVHLANRLSTPDYQYGAYYDLKGAELFSQHVMSWFQTPAFLKKVYERAGMSSEIHNLNDFNYRFKTKQYSAQNFSVLFHDESRETAFKLAQAMDALVLEENTNNQFQIIPLEPVIVLKKVSWPLAITLSLISGLVLSTVFAYLRRYFSS